MVTVDRGQSPSERLAAALATQPTARGRWVRLPVDTDEGERPPTLLDGQEYHVVTVHGFPELAEWVDGPLARGFELDGEPVDVAAVWIASRSGETVRETARLQRGQERVNLRLGPGYKSRLEALARDVGYSLSEQVEAMIGGEELARQEAREGHAEWRKRQSSG